MNIIFIIIYGIWLASEILVSRLLRSKSNDRQNSDKHSLLLIWVTISVFTTAAVFISSRWYLPIFQNPAWQYFGLVIIITGMIFRFIAIMSLGRFFTVNVTIRENHRLKKDGLYRYLRHPSYCASLISFIGFGISLNNWLSVLIITIAITWVFIARIKIEERTLIEHFGSEYLEYMKTTSGFIPFIY